MSEDGDVSRPSREDDRLRDLRAVLTASGAGIYLATHLAGPLPAETLAAIRESDDMELRVGRVGPDREADLEQREHEALAVVAAVVGASPGRLLLAHGAPEAAAAITLHVLTGPSRTGSRVLIVKGTVPSLAAAVTVAAEAASARVEGVDDVPSDLTDVALVVMAHVDRDGGLADVRRAAEATGAGDARLLVDTSLSLGALPVDVADLGADALVAETHRWLLGPEAMAVAWLGPALGDEAPARLRAARGPFGRGALLGLARSVGWLLMYVGLPWLLERTRRLADQLQSSLGAVDGLEILTPAAAAAGPLVAFRIPRWEALLAEEELSRSVFAILEADVEADLLRVSVGAWNREDELERFLARVRELAVHTPETLPRRPTLSVLHGASDGEG